MDIYAFLQQMLETGQIDAVAANNLAQFGFGPRQYLGATLLPERTVLSNTYRESGVRYRTVIASDGGRYSPSQKRGDGRLVGTMLVELGHSDIAREMSGQDFDALVDLLNTNSTMSAASTLLSFTDVAINLALVELNEKQRWDAIVNASVVRKGDNGYTETVTYPNPSGHRAAAGGTWSSDAYDPWDDIIAMKDLLESKGFTVARCITTYAVMNILRGNVNTARRALRTLTVPTGGGDVEFTYAVSDAQVNQVATDNGLPVFEKYDLKYWTEDGQARFMPSDVFVMVAQTGQSEEYLNSLDPENVRFVPDTLGYTALGRAVGQVSPGRTIIVRPELNTKPPRIEFEGWQTSLPVITEPESIAVINTIA